MKTVCLKYIRFAAHLWECNAVTVMLLFALSVVSCGDGKHDEPQRVERPEFELAVVTVRIGETAVNRVVGAMQVNLVSAPGMAAVTLDGCELSVTGKSKGEGVVVVRADGQQVRCSVHVIGSHVEEEEVESQEQILSNLSDGTLRISVGRRLIRYGKAGAMFSMSKDGRGIRAVGLETGETISFSCMDVNLLSTDALTDIKPERVVLEINDSRVELSGCSMVRCDSEGVWVRAVTVAKEPVWVVVPSGF